MQYGRILVPYGRIWCQWWSTKLKKHLFPEMTQKGLETVRVASGSPGNLFLYQNNVFSYKKTVFVPYYLLPLFPC